VSGGATGQELAIAQRQGWVLRWLNRILILGVLVALLAWLWAWFFPPMLASRSLPVVAGAYVASMLRTFALQIGVAVLLTAVVAVLPAIAHKRWRVPAALFLAGVLWLSGDIWPLVRPLSLPGVSAAEKTLTVYACNMLYGRSDPAEIARQARAVGPAGADVIVIQEYTNSTAAAVRAALADWPHVYEEPREGPFGQAVFSRLPFAEKPAPWPSGLNVSSGVWTDPQIAFGVKVGSSVVRIVNIHIYPPLPGMVMDQRQQAVDLSAFVRDHLQAPNASPMILAGDFNCTPRGHHVQAILNAGAIDAWATTRRTRGGTWSALGLKQHLGQIRIDHLLHTQGVRCIDAGIGGKTGSDHLPTWGTFVVR
jgi:endonuclease/exonuclease/phosphatase (EEP) superfamily protein YafD